MGHLFDEDTVVRLARLFTEFTDTTSLGDRVAAVRAFSDACQELLTRYPNDPAWNPAQFADEMMGFVDRLPVIGSLCDYSVIDRMPEVEALRRAREACLPFYPELCRRSTELSQYEDAFQDYATACYSAGIRHGAVYENVRAALEGNR